jgi:hypothetical protein
VTETTGTTRTTRAERLAMPLARQVVLDLAVEHGACIRLVQLRRTDLDSGQVDQVLVPCGHTLASVCPSCAERARSLRAAQCREGWHLEDEPDFTPGPASEDQEWWVVLRAEAQQQRDTAAAAGLTPPTLTLSSPSWTRRSPRRASAASEPRSAGPAAPLDPAPPGCPRPAPPQGHPPDGRQDLYRAGRQDVAPVTVRHLDVLVLWPGRRGGGSRRPGYL